MTHGHGELLGLYQGIPITQRGTGYGLFEPLMARGFAHPRDDFRGAWQGALCVGDAVKHGRDNMREELGDMLLQSVFQAQVCAQDPHDPFDIDEVCDRLVTKLITRHPRAVCKPRGQLVRAARVDGLRLCHAVPVQSRPSGLTPSFAGATSLSYRNACRCSSRSEASCCTSASSEAKKEGHAYDAEVVLLLVSPSVRGQGVGKHLFDWLLGQFKANGVTRYFPGRLRRVSSPDRGQCRV